MTRRSGNKDVAQELVQSGQVQREFYTVQEFAAITCLAVDTVYRMRTRGALAAVRLGGEWRIPREEIDRLKAAALEQVGEKQPA
jgi:excisionase family DNA binding protein